ncbi:MAG: type secretion system protein [Chthoniobacteraceae bacterium]|nr:type secretion system protein [Chthoniobacteraceae bacterium]
MNRFFSSRTPNRGSSLMVVLWALFLLSAAVMAWAKWIQQDLQLTGQANAGLEASAMAHSGVAMALNPRISLESPQLEREVDSGLGYRVRMISEGGKLHINWLLAGEDPRKITILKSWLTSMGLDILERDTVVDCLLDYVDNDNVKRLNGCEDDGDYHPANRPFLTLEEIPHVRGIEALTSKPGWKENLTLYSNGLIEVVSASPEVLRALPGFGDARIVRFIEYRAGVDKILGTADDPPFKSLEEVRSFMGMSKTQFDELGQLIGIKDPASAVMRITSVGHSGKVIRQVELVARKSGLNPAILYWKE